MTPRPRTITCNVGTLQPDAKFTYSYKATVSAAAQGDTPAALVNNACYDANSEDQPDVPFHGCDPATVVVPPAPPAPEPADLGVVKTVSHNIVKPGDTLTWTVVGTNYGPATSTGFVLADALPPGVSFVSASASPELTCTTPAVGATGGSVTCTAPSVPAAPAAGSSLTLTIVATVPDTTADGTLLANIATVSGNEDEPLPDPHPNRDQTLTSVVVPDQPVPPQPIPPLPTPPLPPAPDGPPQPPVVPVHPPRQPGAPADTLLKLTRWLARDRVARRHGHLRAAGVERGRGAGDEGPRLRHAAVGVDGDLGARVQAIGKLGLHHDLQARDRQEKDVARHGQGHDDKHRAPHQSRDGQEPKRPHQAHARHYDHPYSAELHGMTSPPGQAVRAVAFLLT